MEDGQKIDISLESELDVKSSDMLVPVTSPKFQHNRQKFQGHVLPTSLRFEHDGWAAGNRVYQFDINTPNVEAKTSDGKLTFYVTKVLKDNTPTYVIYFRDSEGRLHAKVQYTPDSYLYELDDSDEFYHETSSNIDTEQVFVSDKDDGSNVTSVTGYLYNKSFTVNINNITGEVTFGSGSSDIKLNSYVETEPNFYKIILEDNSKEIKAELHSLYVASDISEEYPEGSYSSWLTFEGYEVVDNVGIYTWYNNLFGNVYLKVPFKDITNGYDYTNATISCENTSVTGMGTIDVTEMLTDFAFSFAFTAKATFALNYTQFSAVQDFSGPSDIFQNNFRLYGSKQSATVDYTTQQIYFARECWDCSVIKGKRLYKTDSVQSKIHICGYLPIWCALLSALNVDFSTAAADNSIYLNNNTAIPFSAFIAGNIDTAATQQATINVDIIATAPSSDIQNSDYAVLNKDESIGYTAKLSTLISDEEHPVYNSQLAAYFQNENIFNDIDSINKFIRTPTVYTHLTGSIYPKGTTWLPELAAPFVPNNPTFQAGFYPDDAIKIISSIGASQYNRTTLSWRDIFKYTPYEYYDSSKTLATYKIFSHKNTFISVGGATTVDLTTVKRPWSVADELLLLYPGCSDASALAKLKEQPTSTIADDTFATGWYLPFDKEGGRVVTYNLTEVPSAWEGKTYTGQTFSYTRLTDFHLHEAVISNSNFNPTTSKIDGTASLVNPPGLMIAYAHFVKVNSVGSDTVNLSWCDNFITVATFNISSSNIISDRTLYAGDCFKQSMSYAEYSSSRSATDSLTLSTSNYVGNPDTYEDELNAMGPWHSCTYDTTSHTATITVTKTINGKEVVGKINISFDETPFAVIDATAASNCFICLNDYTISDTSKIHTNEIDIVLPKNHIIVGISNTYTSYRNWVDSNGTAVYDIEYSQLAGWYNTDTKAYDSTFDTDIWTTPSDNTSLCKTVNDARNAYIVTRRYDFNGYFKSENIEGSQINKGACIYSNAFAQNSMHALYEILTDNNHGFRNNDDRQMHCIMNSDNTMSIYSGSDLDYFRKKVDAGEITWLDVLTAVRDNANDTGNGWQSYMSIDKSRPNSAYRDKGNTEMFVGANLFDWTAGDICRIDSTIIPTTGTTNIIKQKTSSSTTYFSDIDNNNYEYIMAAFTKIISAKLKLKGIIACVKYSSGAQMYIKDSSGISPVSVSKYEFLYNTVTQKAYYYQYTDEYEVSRSNILWNLGTKDAEHQKRYLEDTSRFEPSNNFVTNNKWIGSRITYNANAWTDNTSGSFTGTTTSDSYSNSCFAFIAGGGCYLDNIDKLITGKNLPFNVDTLANAYAQQPIWKDKSSYGNTDTSNLWNATERWNNHNRGTLMFTSKGTIYSSNSSGTVKINSDTLDNNSSLVHNLELVSSDDIRNDPEYSYHVTTLLSTCIKGAWQVTLTQEDNKVFTDNAIASFKCVKSLDSELYNTNGKYFIDRDTSTEMTDKGYTGNDLIKISTDFSKNTNDEQLDITMNLRVLKSDSNKDNFYLFVLNDTKIAETKDIYVLPGHFITGNMSDVLNNDGHMQGVLLSVSDTDSSNYLQTKFNILGDLFTAHEYRENGTVFTYAQQDYTERYNNTISRLSDKTFIYSYAINDSIKLPETYKDTDVDSYSTNSKAKYSCQEQYIYLIVLKDSISISEFISNAESMFDNTGKAIDTKIINYVDKYTQLSYSTETGKFSLVPATLAELSTGYNSSDKVKYLLAPESSSVNISEGIILDVTADFKYNARLQREKLQLDSSNILNYKLYLDKIANNKYTYNYYRNGSKLAEFNFDLVKNICTVDNMSYDISNIINTYSEDKITVLQNATANILIYLRRAFNTDNCTIKTVTSDDIAVTIEGNDYTFSWKELKNVKSTQVFSSVKTDTEKLEDVPFDKVICDNEYQFIKQQWDTDVSTLNYWWIDSSHILQLTQDKLILKQNVKDLSEAEYTGQRLDDWNGDIWREQIVYNKKDYFDSSIIQYGVTNVLNGEKAYMWQLSENDDDTANLRVYDVLSDMTYYDFTIDYKKYPIGKSLKYGISATSTKVTLNTYSNITIKNIVYKSVISAVVNNNRILFGIHENNNLNQWAFIINLSGIKPAIDTSNLVHGYGFIGLDGSLTGGELPYEYVEKSRAGVYGLSTPVQPLDTLRNYISNNSNEADEAIDCSENPAEFVELLNNGKIVGTDEHQWYISNSISGIVSHFTFDGESWTPVKLPLNNNLSSMYSSPSSTNRFVSEYGLNIELFSSLFKFNSDDTSSEDTLNALMYIYLVAVGIPMIYYFCPRTSTIAYLQQTAGQYAYVHYNSETISKQYDAIKQNSYKSDTTPEDLSEGLTGNINTARNVQQDCLSDEISFESKYIQQQTSFDTSDTTLQELCATMLSGAVNLAASIGTEKINAVNPTQNQQAIGDTGKKYSQYFLENIGNIDSTNISISGDTPNLTTKVSSVLTLDMFYSTSDTQKVYAGPGYVNHNFVAACTAQSVTMTNVDITQKCSMWMLKELTILQATAVHLATEYGANALIDSGKYMMSSQGPTVFGTGPGGLPQMIIGGISLTMGYAMRIASVLQEVFIKSAPDLLNSISHAMVSNVNAKVVKYIPTIEGKHRYGMKSETFMWPCFDVPANQKILDESVLSGFQNKKWKFELPITHNSRLGSGKKIKPSGKAETIGARTYTDNDKVFTQFKGDVSYHIASCKGITKSVLLPDDTAYVIGAESILPNRYFKNENLDMGDVTFSAPVIQDYIINKDWKLSRTATAGATVWLSCKDTKLIDGDCSNMFVSDNFCGVSSSYTAIEIKRGISNEYIRPALITPDTLGLNQTGLNCCYNGEAYHGFDGYGYRLVSWVGAAGMNKNYLTLAYNFIANDRFKRSNKLPVNQFLGNFKSDPTTSLTCLGTDKIFTLTTQPTEAKGLESGAIGEDKDALRYALPVFTEYVNTLPSAVKTLSSYNLAVIEGITGLVTDLRTTQSAYKIPESVDFAIGKQLYRVTREYICTLVNKNGVSVATDTVPVLGLSYLGATPTEAYFYNQATRQYYVYTGGANLQVIDMLERFRDIKNGRYDFVNQTVAISCLATFKRLNKYIKDDTDETDNIIVPVLKEGKFIGEVYPPNTNIFNNASWYKTVSLPSGITYQGPNRCIINRYVYTDYMKTQIKNNFGKWKRIEREVYNPFRTYKYKYSNVTEQIGDKVEVNGWTHNPFLLVTAPLGVSENIDCMFEWEITFAWTEEMDKLYANDNYAVVNIIAETMTPGGKVVPERVTHIYLTKELFTRTGNYGYYSFRYQSNNGAGNRERLHVWSDQYIAVSSLQLEYKTMTVKRTEILTQAEDVKLLKEL